MLCFKISSESHAESGTVRVKAAGLMSLAGLHWQGEAGRQSKDSVGGVGRQCIGFLELPKKKKKKQVSCCGCLINNRNLFPLYSSGVRSLKSCFGRVLLPLKSSKSFRTPSFWCLPAIFRCSQAADESLQSCAMGLQRVVTQLSDCTSNLCLII